MPFLPSPANAILALSKNRVRRTKEEERVLSSFVLFFFPLEAQLLFGRAHCWTWSSDGRFQAPGTIGRWWGGGVRLVIVWAGGGGGLCSGSSHARGVSYSLYIPVCIWYKLLGYSTRVHTSMKSARDRYHRLSGKAA